MDKYGGVCHCCGEDELLFLTIDHKNGGGSADRAKGLTGTRWYLHLLRTAIREDLEVLCYNCNIGKEGGGGICPHKSGKTDLSSIQDLRRIKRFNIGCKVEWPSDDELLAMCREIGTRAVAARLGVSPSAPLKRLQRRGLAIRQDRHLLKKGIDTMDWKPDENAWVEGTWRGKKYLAQKVPYGGKGRVVLKTEQNGVPGVHYTYLNDDDMKDFEWY